MLRDITPCRDFATTCYDTGLFHPDPPLLPLRTSDLDTEFYHTDMKVLAVHCHGQPTCSLLRTHKPGSPLLLCPARTPVQLEQVLTHCLIAPFIRPL